MTQYRWTVWRVGIFKTSKVLVRSIVKYFGVDHLGPVFCCSATGFMQLGVDHLGAVFCCSTTGFVQLGVDHLGPVFCSTPTVRLVSCNLTFPPCWLLITSLDNGDGDEGEPSEGAGSHPVPHSLQGTSLSLSEGGL